MTNNAIILAAVIGLIGTIGHLMLIKSLSLGEASLVAPFSYSSLLFATVWGAILFNSFPDIWTIFGSVIIVGAGVYVWARERALASDEN